MLTQRWKRVAVVLWTVAVWPERVDAQTLLYEYDGNAAVDLFGFACAAAGDVDGDGVGDFIVGSLGEDSAGPDAGMAVVYSGRDGGLLHLFQGDADQDWFGYSVAGAGDTNADGYADILIGDYRDDTAALNAGAAVLYSGCDGSVLKVFNGAAAADGFGFTVCGCGDVNQDGYDDLAITSAFADDGGLDGGKLEVFSGFDGGLLFNATGQSGDQLGGSAAGAGDVNRDGYDDLVVGARYADINGIDSGQVRVLSGRDGSLIRQFSGESAGDEFGVCVAAAGDLDDDGYDDVVIGALGSDRAALDGGLVQVLSGADGRVLREFEGTIADSGFGFAVAGGEDLNGDGVEDLVIGAFQDAEQGLRNGSVQLYSGATGGLLYRFAGSATGDNFGWSVAALGDLDNDRFSELLLGAPRASPAGIWSGRAQVHSGNDLFLAASSTLAQPGDSVTFTTLGGVPGALTHMFTTQINGNPLFTSIASPTAFSGDGLRDLRVNVQPGISGAAVSLQALAIGPAGVLVDSNAVVVVAP